MCLRQSPHVASVMWEHERSVYSTVVGLTLGSSRFHHVYACGDTYMHLINGHGSIRTYHLLWKSTGSGVEVAPLDSIETHRCVGSGASVDGPTLQRTARQKEVPQHILP